MHLVVVTLTANTFPDYPTCSFIGWLGFCEFFCLVPHLNYLACLLPGLQPPARALGSNNTLQITFASSQARLALAGASGGGKEGAKCHPGSLLTADLNPESAAATVGALMCPHCSLKLSLSAMGPLSGPQN